MSASRRPSTTPSAVPGAAGRPVPRTLSRRDVLRLGATATAGLYVATHSGWRPLAADAAPLAQRLSDPALQPKFTQLAPNALDPGFKYAPNPSKGFYDVWIRRAKHFTGLVNKGGQPVSTTIFGYGDDRGPTWPGRTFEVTRTTPGDVVRVRWNNDLGRGGHILPVDTSLHWAYSLPGYEDYTIKRDGVPIVTHLHGGNSDYQFDGNPEFFYSPDGEIVGPQWDGVDGGFTNLFEYNNDVPAGTLWYHDHALGLTRLNVYAGLAGFYIVRDELDTGLPGNPLGLPAFPYELAYAIQDRMFTDRGDLFYPAFPGDPFYDDFITGEGADLPPEQFKKGGPTALAEFFGDHMVVNGKLWPKQDVEPRNYRMRLLNGTDSRFMVLQFVDVAAGSTDPSGGTPLPFWVIGSDQGLGTPRETDTLVSEPGGRYDVVVDFSQVEHGRRVIMKNLGGDAPFGGAYGDALDPDELFPDRQTDRIMAFDVVVPLSGVDDGFDPSVLSGYDGVASVGAATRRVALFEGTDEFGRLQPLLGTVDDPSGTNVATAHTWFQPTTETPALGGTEIWEIYNFTADAHPIHLHLVSFEILDRVDFEYDVTGTQTTQQHNGTTGEAPEISNIRNLTATPAGDEYFEEAPKDMVTSLPGDPEGAPPTGQMVRIRTRFDKPGRYVWHCHILSHEDHEMMRVLQVVPHAV